MVGHPYVTRQDGRGRTREKLPDVSVASIAPVPVTVPASISIPPPATLRISTRGRVPKRRESLDHHGQCRAFRSTLLVASPGPLSPLPRRDMSLTHPQAFLAPSRFLLQPFQHRIYWRIFPIPPAPALFDQHVIDVGAIGQEDIRKGASVLVEAVGLDGHFLTEGRSWAGVVRQRHQNFLKRLLNSTKVSERSSRNPSIGPSMTDPYSGGTLDRVGKEERTYSDVGRSGVRCSPAED